MAYHYSFLSKTDKGNRVLTACGVLTTDVPALAKTEKGHYTTPILVADGDGKRRNYFKKDGEPIELHTLRRGKEPQAWTGENPQGKTQEKSLLLLVNKGSDKVEFYKLEGWKHIAKMMHLYFKKGDEIMIMASEVKRKNVITSREETVWNVQFAKKVEKKPELISEVEEKEQASSEENSDKESKKVESEVKADETNKEKPVEEKTEEKESVKTEEKVEKVEDKELESTSETVDKTDKTSNKEDKPEEKVEDMTVVEEESTVGENSRYVIIEDEDDVPF